MHFLFDPFPPRRDSGRRQKVPKNQDGIIRQMRFRGSPGYDMRINEMGLFVAMIEKIPALTGWDNRLFDFGAANECITVDKCR